MTKLVVTLDGDIVGASAELRFKQDTNYTFQRSLSGESFYEKIADAAERSRTNGGHPVGVAFWGGRWK